MSEDKKSAGSQIRKLDESFGQESNRTNQSNCANQDADLMEDGINDECANGACSR